MRYSVPFYSFYPYRAILKSKGIKPYETIIIMERIRFFVTFGYTKTFRVKIAGFREKVALPVQKNEGKGVGALPPAKFILGVLLKFMKYCSKHCLSGSESFLHISVVVPTLPWSSRRVYRILGARNAKNPPIK